MAKARAESSTEVARVNFHIDRKLHSAFKAATAAQGKNMTDVLLEFIREYVHEHLPRGLRPSARKE